MSVMTAPCRSWSVIIISSSNGNIFRVTGHLCGEFTGHRWIPCTKASDAELWCLNKRLSKQSWGWWIETLSDSLWRHYNDEYIHSTCSKTEVRGQRIFQFAYVCTDTIQKQLSDIDCLAVFITTYLDLLIVLSIQSYWHGYASYPEATKL